MQRAPDSASATAAHSSTRHLPACVLTEVCQLTVPGQQLLEHAAERLPFTARTTATVLRVARTIADLAGKDCITPPYLAEALQYQRRVGV